MAADLTTLLRLHDRLEERAEDGRRDARPVEDARLKQLRAHLPTKPGERQPFGEEFAIDPGELVQIRE